MRRAGSMPWLIQSPVAGTDGSPENSRQHERKHPPIGVQSAGDRKLGVFNRGDRSGRLRVALGFLELDLTGIRKADGFLGDGASCDGDLARIDAGGPCLQVGFDHSA